MKQAHKGHDAHNTETAAWHKGSGALLVTVMTVLLTGAQAVPMTPTPGSETHLFILSGQSNMAGLDPTLSFIPAVEAAFGKDRVIVVKDALGGQPIRRWYKNWKPAVGNEPKATGDLYDRLMTRVNAAIQGQSIQTITFVWMQGERDAREQHGQVYGASFKGLLEQLREDLQRQDINFVIGRLSDFDMDNQRYPHWTRIRQVQVALAEAASHGAWVDTDDLNDGKNGQGKRIINDLHYSVQGYRTLGQRFADKAIELIHKNDLARGRTASSHAPAHKRPNILFILADDQSPFDLKMYNPDSILDTPALDRLAAQGMVFDGAYHMGSWSGAVCTPSRHMIMSGRTVWHIPGGGNANARDGKIVPVDLAENTMAAVFNRAGYATMRTCKKGNSYAAANEKFTVRHDSSKRGDTDETGSAWHAEQVLNYLNDRQARQDAKPFMIYYGFSHPHDPRNGKVDLLAKYGAHNHRDKNTLPPGSPRQPALPVNYLPAHPFHHGHPGLRDEVKVSGVWERRDERTIRNELGREFACSENIDIQVGRVLEKLEDMGELDNTYIVYTADHGIAIGRHGLAGKQNLYEHTWRVPFIVKGPGIKPGSRVQGNIYLLDTLGTLCDLAGIAPPKTVESRSFRRVLEGQQETVRDVLFGVYSGGTKPGMRAVRQGDWKLIKYDVMDGTVRKTQLFNLKDNPHEYLKEHHAAQVVALTDNTPTSSQVNLAGDPIYADKLADMETLLLSEMRRLDDPYRLWDQPDDGLTPPVIQPRKKKKK